MTPHQYKVMMVVRVVQKALTPAVVLHAMVVERMTQKALIPTVVLHNRNTPLTPSVVASDDDSNHYRVQSAFIPDLELHLRSINEPYNQLSMTPTNDDLVNGYHNLCQQDVFKFKSKQKLFPLKRYKRHFKIRHDLDVDVCKVDGDPQQVVRCVLCDCLGYDT